MCRELHLKGSFALCLRVSRLPRADSRDGIGSIIEPFRWVYVFGNLPNNRLFRDLTPNCLQSRVFGKFLRQRGRAGSAKLPEIPFSRKFEHAGSPGLFGVHFAVAMPLVNQSGPPIWF